MRAASVPFSAGLRDFRLHRRGRRFINVLLTGRARPGVAALEGVACEAGCCAMRSVTRPGCAGTFRREPSLAGRGSLAGFHRRKPQ